MMDAFGEIVEGILAALELERELGTRIVECDRSVLEVSAVAPSVSVSAAATPKKIVPNVALKPIVAPTPAVAAPTVTPEKRCRLVFLHRGPFAAKEQEMIDKIVKALIDRKAPEPVIVTEGECPACKIAVVLGFPALRQWFPQLNGAPGQWLMTDTGIQVLVTYSPRYILKCAKEEDVARLKHTMWTSLKGMMQRV